MDAFVPHGKLTRPGMASGPLKGLTVAVKDLFDWAGVPTGAGNPTWLATHEVPASDAAAVAAVWNAGATLAGKTVTDELAYSIHGDNLHYGTPVNPAAPGRVPGGSSSGSASAVAAGLADAALGTDTGGSVRVPAAYCGLYGLRTTHGAVNRAGLVPLAPTFDTVGWFARDPGTLGTLAAVLTPGNPRQNWARAWVLPDSGGLADEPTGRALTETLDRFGLPVAALDGLTDEFGGLEGLRQTYVTLQGWEAWESHGAWITSHRPVFAPAIAKRFAAASQVTGNQAETARTALSRFRARLRSALGSDGVLVLPAAEGPPPGLTDEEAVVEGVRARTMRLTCLAGLAGLPQVTVPFRGNDGLPRGVGLVGPAGADLALTVLAAQAGGL